MTTTQEKILEYVKTNPKASLRIIARAVGLTFSVVNYHLGSLALSGRLLKDSERFRVIEPVDK